MISGIRLSRGIDERSISRCASSLASESVKERYFPKEPSPAMPSSPYEAWSDAVSAMPGSDMRSREISALLRLPPEASAETEKARDAPSKTGSSEPSTSVPSAEAVPSRVAESDSEASSAVKPGSTTESASDANDGISAVMVPSEEADAPMCSEEKRRMPSFVSNTSSNAASALSISVMRISASPASAANPSYDAAISLRTASALLSEKETEAAPDETSAP